MPRKGDTNRGLTLPAKKAVSKIVKRAVNAIIENKDYPTNQLNAGGAASNVNSTTGQFQLLNGMGIGGNNSQRVGDKLRPVQLKVGYHVNQAIGAGVDSMTRILIVNDKLNAGVAPTQALILEQTAVGTTNHIHSPYNIDNVPTRFEILADKLVSSALAGQFQRAGNIMIRKKLPASCNYITTGTFGGKNTLYSLLMSNVAIAGAGIPEVGLTSRLTYKDA